MSKGFLELYVLKIIVSECQNKDWKAECLVAALNKPKTPLNNIWLD